jgi:hypothetical protein
MDVSQQINYVPFATPSPLPPLRWQEEKSVVDRLFEIGMEYDVIFSPIFASHEEWDGGIFRKFPVYGDIMRDGALVA